MNSRIILIVWLAMALTACHSHSHENEKSHDHGDETAQSENLEEGHEHVKVQYTAYTTSYELFAESDVFVVGEKANVLSHFSLLPSFKALEAGSITAVLTVNGREVRQTLDAPTRKGIYSFDLVPETAGTGTLHFQIDTAVVSTGEVMVYPNHNDAHAHPSPAEPSMVNKVVFTKEQSWKIDFKTETVRTQPFGQVIKTVARIEPATGNETDITAKAGGIVSFSANNLVEGKEVTAGQSLFRIASGGMMENNLAVKISEAKNNFNQAEANYNRKKELAVDRIISEKELLEAHTSYENARAVVENLVNNTTEGGQNITSPMKGFLKQIWVSNGQYVEAGQRLATVSQNHSLMLNAYVQPQYSKILSSLNSAHLKTLNDNKSYTFEELNGKVLSYGKSVNDNNFLIPVYLQIDNKADFIQGSMVEIYLKTMTNSQALTIPNSALLEEQGIYFVYVQETPELFEKRQVITGVTDGINTEIISGLNVGERIVTQGAMLIKLAQAAGALDPHSGHVH